jgi:hypothetical protein
MDVHRYESFEHAMHGETVEPRRLAPAQSTSPLGRRLAESPARDTSTRTRACLRGYVFTTTVRMPFALASCLEDAMSNTGVIGTRRHRSQGVAIDISG